MSESESKPADAFDHAVDESRELIGVPLRRDRMQFVSAASRDAIRHFAMGIGDDNPLWASPEYAAASRWGSLLAPPTYLYAVDATIIAPKMSGYQWIYAGTTWRWLDVIREGDEFDTTAMLTDCEVKSGRRMGRWALQRGEVTYRRADGATMAIAEGRTARTLRNPAERSGLSAEPATRTADEPAAPDDVSVVRRGSRSRCVEDVDVGSQITTLVKGPLAISDIVDWYRGAQGALHYGGALGDGVRYRRRHQDFRVNPETGAKEFAAGGHFDTKQGAELGMEGAYDVGPQRISWAGQMLCDWAGDEGFLALLAVDVLRPNVVGDSTYWFGHVTSKHRLDGNNFLACDLEARNQRAQVTARGSAVVALPSRELGSVRLPLTTEHSEVLAALAAQTARRTP